MRGDPADGSVTGRVVGPPTGGGVGTGRSGVSAGTSKVDADLADLRTLASVLATIHDEASDASGKSASIEWGLPLSGDLLSPTTAATCASSAAALAVNLTAASMRAQLLGLLVAASIETYELAESSAQARMQRLVAIHSLWVCLSRVALHHETGRPIEHDTIAVAAGDIIALIDAALPGSYETDMAAISAVAVGNLGRGGPVTTSLVAGPGSAKAPPAARTVGDTMGRISALYPDSDDAAHVQVQRVVDPATGQGRWVAMIPGTSTFMWNAKNPLDTTGNIIAASGRPSGGEEAVSRALRDAMKREGVLGLGEPVMLVGHSQGGMVMTNLARRGSDGLNVTHVVTYGSPVGASAVPAGVSALNVEDRADPVPRLDGRATGDGDPRRTRLLIDDPTTTLGASGGSSPFGAHDADKYRWNYEATMDRERGRPGPPSAAVDFETSAAPFFQGDAHTYRYDAMRQASAEAQQNGADRLLTCTSETPRKLGAGPHHDVGPGGQYRVTSP